MYHDIATRMAIYSLKLFDRASSSSTLSDNRKAARHEADQISYYYHAYAYSDAAPRTEKVDDHDSDDEDCD